MLKKMPRPKKSCHLEGIVGTTATEKIEWMKNQPMLKQSTAKNKQVHQGNGHFVWAKNFGSVYWPAFIAKLDDKPGSLQVTQEESDCEDPSQYTFVMFMEKRFRIAFLPWDRIIILEESSFEYQRNLIVGWNKLVVKKGWHPNDGFNLACKLLQEFFSVSPSDRQLVAEQRYNFDKRFKPETSKSSKETLKSRSSQRIDPYENIMPSSSSGGQLRKQDRYCLRTSLPTDLKLDLQINREVPSTQKKPFHSFSTYTSKMDISYRSDITNFNDISQVAYNKKTLKSRSSRRIDPYENSMPSSSSGGQLRKQDRYCLRTSLPTAVKLDVQINREVPNTQKQPLHSFSFSTNTSKMDISYRSTSNFSDISQAAYNKKTGRPNLGGELLKTWTQDRFAKTDKKLTFESSNEIDCASCTLKITKDKVLCHDFPFHKGCLIEVQLGMTRFEGENEINYFEYKCRDCQERRCFLCKSTDGDVTKCQKCDLRFHRTCLKQPWPQAEIHGSSGPIICPLHFCHTCKAEEKFLNKLRDTRLVNNKGYHCIYCLASYHKAGCLPAGCGSTVMANHYIICPRHHNGCQNRVNKQRRLGCFACNKRLLEKEEHVECKRCFMLYHPLCTGYTEEDIKNGLSLKEYGRDFLCNTCCWGLYPLYGQVIWFQQPGSSFWPSIILYPKESANRARAKPGYYSVFYFGSQPSYFDWASRGVPFHIASLEFLTKLNLYNEKPNMLTAYEEAGYALNLSEEYRDSMLPKPEPVYKRADKNLYRIKFKRTSGGADGWRRSLVLTQSCGKCPCDASPMDVICEPGTGCYNRDAAVECDESNCGGKERCTNRMFSTTRDIDHLEACMTENKGWGVKAKKYLQKGDFITEYIGEVISKEEMIWRLNKKTEADPLYILEIDFNTFIDAEYMGNLSRLMNHSCSPNCKTEKYVALGKPVVGVFARREIFPGEEVTFNYAYTNESADNFKCYCGTKDCKGYIGKKISENEENQPNNKRKRLEPDAAEVEISVTEDTEDNWNNNCDVCSFGGHVILCDHEGCRKVYHLKCVGIRKAPAGDWICPSHNQTKMVPKKKKQRLGDVSFVSDIYDSGCVEEVETPDTAQNVIKKCNLPTDVSNEAERVSDLRVDLIGEQNPTCKRNAPLKTLRLN